MNKLLGVFLGLCMTCIFLGQVAAQEAPGGGNSQGQQWQGKNQANQQAMREKMQGFRQQMQQLRHKMKEEMVKVRQIREQMKSLREQIRQAMGHRQGGQGMGSGGGEGMPGGGGEGMGPGGQ